MAQRTGATTKKGNGVVAGKGVLMGLIRCAGCGNALTGLASGPADKRFAAYHCKGRRASGKCPAPATAKIDLVDALVLPEIEKRVAAGEVDMEGMLVDLYDAQVAWDAAAKELDAFLADAKISVLGADLYAQEVARRRDDVQTAAAAYKEQLNAQERIAAGPNQSDMEQRREIARQLIESVTLTKAATHGRWGRIEDRVEVVWKNKR